jgi:hypothetical protein
MCFIEEHVVVFRKGNWDFIWPIIKQSFAKFEFERPVQSWYVLSVGAMFNNKSVQARYSRRGLSPRERMRRESVIVLDGTKVSQYFRLVLRLLLTTPSYNSTANYYYLRLGSTSRVQYATYNTRYLRALNITLSLRPPTPKLTKHDAYIRSIARI